MHYVRDDYVEYYKKIMINTIYMSKLCSRTMFLCPLHQHPQLSHMPNPETLITLLTQVSNSYTKTTMISIKTSIKSHRVVINCYNDKT
ncbi:hypothetical protein Hanom_Chr03g00246421 [Helianthus anomalus]